MPYLRKMDEPDTGLVELTYRLDNAGNSLILEAEHTEKDLLAEDILQRRGIGGQVGGGSF